MSPVRKGYERVVVTMPGEQDPRTGVLVLTTGTVLLTDQQTGMIVKPVTEPASAIDAAERATLATQVAAELADAQAEIRRLDGLRIQTELEAATIRSDRDMALKALERERKQRSKDTEQATAAERQWATYSHRMGAALRRLAEVYGIEGDFDDAWVAWHDPEGDDTLIPNDSRPGVLAAFLDRMADAQHPSVTFPIVGADVLRAAEDAARGVLGQLGGTVGGAVLAALTEAAEHSRPPAGRLVGVADTKGKDLDQRSGRTS